MKKSAAYQRCSVICNRFSLNFDLFQFSVRFLSLSTSFWFFVIDECEFINAFFFAVHHENCGHLIFWELWMELQPQYSACHCDTCIWYCNGTQSVINRQYSRAKKMAAKARSRAAYCTNAYSFFACLFAYFFLFVSLHHTKSMISHVLDAYILLLHI